MHTASMSRMQWFRDQFLNENLAHPRAILDVGSYDVNGCYRELFKSAKFAYTGLDMEPGPNVDIAVNPLPLGRSTHGFIRCSNFWTVPGALRIFLGDVEGDDTGS